MQEGKNAYYIEKLLDYLPSSEITKQLTNGIEHQLQKELTNGYLVVTDLQTDFKNYINRNAKDAALKNIFQSQDYYNYEKDISIMLDRYDIIEEQVKPPKRQRKKVIQQQNQIQKIKSQKQIQREFLLKMKQWANQKAKIVSKKRELQKKKILMQNSLQQKKQKEKIELEAFLKLQKQKIIERKLREMKERSHHRQEILKQSSIKHSQSLPKYLNNELKFIEFEKQKEKEREILLKNRKLSLEVGIDDIKKHQKAYINRIKQRLNMRSKKQKQKAEDQSLSKSNDKNFNLHKKDIEQMKKLEEKIKRIKRFQNKVRLMPLKIDEEKKRQRLINQDKIKNKKKYIFLSQKALSDEQIYDQFKEFDINIDRNEIGNQYLQEIRQQNPLKRKANSLTVLPSVEQESKKPEYKNYLKEFRDKRHIINPDEAEIAIKKVDKIKNKNEGKKILLQKSDKYEKKVIKNIMQLKKLNNYPDSVKKQEEIDDNFMKAIKVKLALAKIE